MLQTVKRFRLGNPGEMYRRSQWAYIPHEDPIGFMEEEFDEVFEQYLIGLCHFIMAYFEREGIKPDLTCIGPEP